MKSLSKCLFDCLQWCQTAATFGLAHYHRVACPVLSDVAGKSQKIKCSGLPLLSPVVTQGETPKAYQSGFLRMDFQTKFPQPLFQGRQTFPGIPVLLESQHSVVGIPDHHHVPLRMLSGFVQPQIEAVVQVNVSKYR